MSSRSLPVLLSLLTTFISTTTPAREPVEQIEVFASPENHSLTSLSADQARAELNKIAGGASLVNLDDERNASTANLKEILEFTPGLFIQSRFGADEVRTSIRGSGVSQTFNLRGITLLRDGLPLSEADGNLRPQLLEPITADYIEVYRGANALQYGSATLGGAINLVSPTGYSKDKNRIRIEAGSDGLIRPQLSTGFVSKSGWDGFASYSAINQDGFREHSEQDTQRFYGNLGYRFSDKQEGRLHLNIQDNNLELPGSLTWAQLRENPEQSGRFQDANAQRDVDLFRVAYQHTFLPNEQDRLDIGVFYQDQDFFHPLPFFVQRGDIKDYGLSWRHSMTGTLLGKANSFTWGGAFRYGTDDNRRTNAFTAANPTALRRIEESFARTFELFAENRWSASQNIDLILGLQATRSQRDVEDQSFNLFQAEIDEDESYTGFSPKLGLTWQASADTLLFANISRSYEPPTNGQFVTSVNLGGFPPNLLVVTGIDAQRATTFEIGGRGSWKNWQWDIAAYYAKVKDELLAQEVIPGSGVTATTNADDTLHYGVELGLNGTFPLHLLAENDHLALRTVYTWTDLSFDNDTDFGDNDIPGIPPHLARAELSYRHPAGYFVGANLETASSYYVDYANSLKNESYTVVGLTAGYELNERLRFFIEVKNLGDKRYASNTSLTADANGQDRAVFNPGIGRSYFGGLEYRFK